MSLPLPRQPGYTLADWASWEGRWELLNGVAYDMTPAPSPQHQRLSSRLERGIEGGRFGEFHLEWGGVVELMGGQLSVTLE